MRKAIFIVAIIVGIGIVAAAQGTVSVGVEETYASEWEQFATDLEAQSGVTLGIQPYSDTYLQLWLRFSRFQLSMIQEGWVSIYSRYLEDLSEIENQLTASGVELVYHGNKPVAVPISFAPGWLLAVRAWPARGTQDVAAVLSAVAAGTAAPDRVVSTGIGQTYGAAKMARAEHNPHVDGALTALVQAVESTVGTMSAANLADLPSVARNTVSAVANAFGVPLSTEESTVTVVMEASFGNAVNASLAALSALGISDVDVAAASNLIRASVPLPLLEAVLGQLSGTVYIRPPYVPHELDIDGEGVAAIGAAAFHAQGITGSGTKIAVIDLGFSGLSQSQASGDLPYGAFTYDASGTGIASGVSHGTAVAEVVHETAPDAQLYLIKIGDEVDLDQAVTYCINNGIDIINHSLGWYNTNFYDGTGPIAEIAQRAVDGGILWVNSAGNEAQRHWEGSFADANTDGKLDTSISLQAQAGQRVVLYLTWNEWPASSTDYDLYVYDPLENVIAASTKYQTGTEEPTESVQFQANMNGTYRIEVAGSGSERMELFSLFQGLSPVVASSSLIAPANVADVVTVGAISFSPYSGTVQIQPYSSRGPTNDGRSKPDLVGPDSVSTSVSGYAPFLGTSCASPHVAGAAALLLSDEPSLTVSQLRAEVVSQVVPVGDANIFGAGRLLLSLAPANQPPVASFTVSPSSPVTGQAASFNGLGSYDVDGTISQYSWQFGDGTTGAGATTSHAYSSAGTYTARLTVTDDDGATHSTTRSVTVAAPQLPDLVISDITHSPATPQIGASVGFQITIRNQGTVSAGLFRVRIQGASSAASTYVWQLSAGNSTTVSLSRTLTQSSETFTVRLDDLSQIEESNESNNTATHTVTAGVPAPVADAGGPYSGTTGQPVSFSAAGSTGTISSYTWSFGDGATGFGITPTHSYASATTYTVTLTVSGPGGQDTDTAQVQISPAVLPPVASAGGPYSGTVGQPVSFSAAGSVGSISSYTWSFGDGATGFGATPTHSYAAAITYTVTLTVSGPGGQDTDTAQVQISPAVLPPVANAGGPYSGTVGQPVSFSAAGSTGTISSYTWSFGDGATGFGATPTHSYAAATTYTVTLTVAGPGGQDTDVTQIQVSPAAPALSLELSLPKSSYQLDEPLTLFYTLNRTAYVYICEADSSGRVSLLFPNYREPNPRVTVGNRQLPGVPGYTLTVSEPTGTDTIYAFAATSPIPSFPTSFSSSFPVLSYNPIGFRDSVLSSLQSQFASGDWAYDTVTFTIEEPAPTTGTLQITSSPSGATVIIDGNTVGTTPGSATLSAGIHTVQLTRAGYVPETRTVQITAGQSSSLNVILTPETVNQPPNAAFTVSPSSPSVNQVVSFNAGSSTDPDGTILSYSWSFGDGATGTGMQPTHVYTGGGTFTVQLTVTDNQGASDSTTRSVSVSIPSFSEPRAFWQFNEGSGSTAFDASANANHGTLQGATWDTNDADGTFAVRLDGSNDSVSVPHAPSLSLFEEFTFEAWVRYDTVPTADAPILRKPDAYRLVLKQSQLKLILVINGSTRTVTASIPTIAVDRWYQVAATYDGSRVRLYLNGQEVAEQAISGAINQTTSPVSIGRADSDVIDGMIDNVRIFGRALAPSEFNLLPPGTTPENQPPVADFTWSPGTPSVNEFVRFRSNSSDPEDGTNVSVRWTFGNGGIGGGGSPRIRYTQARQYTVTITVTDSEGLETSLSKVITVVP